MEFETKVISLGGLGDAKCVKLSGVWCIRVEDMLMAVFHCTSEGASIQWDFMKRSYVVQQQHRFHRGPISDVMTLDDTFSMLMQFTRGADTNRRAYVLIFTLQSAFNIS